MEDFENLKQEIEKVSSKHEEFVLKTKDEIEKLWKALEEKFEKSQHSV